MAGTGDTHFFDALPYDVEDDTDPSGSKAELPTDSEESSAAQTHKDSQTGDLEAVDGSVEVGCDVSKQSLGVKATEGDSENIPPADESTTAEDLRQHGMSTLMLGMDRFEFRFELGALTDYHDVLTSITSNQTLSISDFLDFAL